MRTTLALTALLLLAVVPPGMAQPAAGTTEAAGLVFRTLSADDLDSIQRATGYRLGVAIAEVKPGTPGAAAGYKAGDVILAVGKTGVDSAEKAAAAIRAATGEVDCASVIKAGDTFEAQVVKLKLGSPAPAAQAAPPQGATVGGPNPNADPIGAYFDMLDFIRSQAWARSVVTTPEERQRVAALVQQAWGTMDATAQGQIMALPQAWAQLQTNWKAASEADKQRQKALWADALLMPGNLYPPPLNPQKFAAPGNIASVEYPGDWTGGMTEVEGTPFAFIGPNGAQASWQQVLDTPNSPAGALFAIAEVPAGMQNATYVDGARALAQMLIPNGIASLREIQALPIGEIGAIITVVGKFPGQDEEKFYWIGVTQFGQGKIFAGRMGGKVAEADSLIPAFTYMLGTLQLNPPAPAGGGGGGVSGAWEAAWSRVDVAITKNIWAK